MVAPINFSELDLGKILIRLLKYLIRNTKKVQIK